MSKADFESRSWPFTPARVQAAIKYARESTISRWVWRDSNPAVKGLHLIVGKDSAVFYHRGKPVGARRETFTRLGDAEGPAALYLEEARLRANQIQFGAELTSVRRSKADSIGIRAGHVADQYFREVEAGTFTLKAGRNRPLSPKTIKGYRSNYRKHLGPAFGEKDLGQLLADGPDLIRKIAAESPALGNQVLAVAVALVEYARRRNMFTGLNPFKDDLRSHVPGRDLDLHQKDLNRLVDTIHDEEEFWSSFFLFLAITGRRLANAQGLRWDWIDFDKGLITYPAGATKAKRRSQIPITDPIRALLEVRREKVPACSPWVWPQAKDDQKPVRSPHKAWDRIRAKAGVPDLTIHHLRHLAATLASSAEGVETASVVKLIDHADPATTLRIYAHLQAEAARPAMEALGKVWSKKSQSE